VGTLFAPDAIPEAGVDHRMVSPFRLPLDLDRMVLEDAQKQGITCVDFLRGDEPYKLSWGPAIAVNVRRHLWLED
jgi:hypothetical protein